jgi:hypothetical protein
MHWMVSIIAWIQIALKSGFKFRTKLPLGVRASDASDLLMVGYLLEVLFDRSPFGGHHVDKVTTFHEFPVGVGPDLRVVVRCIWIKGRC